MTIYFDMDGTIADLYGVNNWLHRIRAYDAKIYAEARPLCNMNTLARKLNKIQRKGVKIGVISWGSKDKNPAFLEAVKAEKMRWLRQHLRSVSFDEIHIVEYGTKKTNFRSSSDDILFDDETGNLIDWGNGGFHPDAINEVLGTLAK